MVSVFWPPFPLYARAFFLCVTALFLKNSHRAGPVLQEFGLVLRAGVWHSTSVVQAVPWASGWSPRFFLKMKRKKTEKKRKKTEKKGRKRKKSEPPKNSQKANKMQTEKNGRKRKKNGRKWKKTEATLFRRPLLRNPDLVMEVKIQAVLHRVSFKGLLFKTLVFAHLSCGLSPFYCRRRCWWSEP